MADQPHTVAEQAVGGANAALSTVYLSAFRLRREPPRPLADRQPGYESLFDYDTLFYDVFRTGDGNGVVCLGPPLLNCETTFAEAVFRVPGTNSPLVYEYQRPRLDTQPSCRFYLRGPEVARTQSLILDAAGRSLEIPIRSSGRTHFAGRRVITTLSKNNPLAWIGDWIEFNVRVHGADAAIIYDNGSTDYDLDDVRQLLSSIDGLAVHLAIPWKFPYGPGVVGPRRVQDSFYCQPGALDHVRRRYCTAARGVLNTDIDELVVTPSGETIFERLEQSRHAVIKFSGIWAETTGSKTPQSIRHADFRYRRWNQVTHRWVHRLNRSRWSRSFRQLLRTKWIAVPSRCNDDMEWGIHDVYLAGKKSRPRNGSWKLWPTDIIYRHLRQLTIGRNHQRKKVEHFSAFRYIYDKELARALDLAFPEQSPSRNIQGWSRVFRRSRS